MGREELQIMRIDNSFKQFCGKIYEVDRRGSRKQSLTYLYFVSCFKDEMSRYCNGNNPVKRENMMIHRKDGRIAVNHVLLLSVLLDCFSEQSSLSLRMLF